MRKSQGGRRDGPSPLEVSKSPRGVGTLHGGLRFPPLAFWGWLVARDPLLPPKGREREKPSDHIERGSDHQVAQTNPPVRGRVSADRSEEAAQPLTTPRLVRKSSTDDSVRLHCMWGLRAFGRVTPAFPGATEVPLHGLRKDGSRHVP